MNHTQIMDLKAPEIFMVKSMLLPRIALAILFRIGSILIQVSSIPVNNVNTILMQNIIELSVSTITFFVFGYTIVFGDLTDPKWTFGSIFTTTSEREIEYAVYAWTAITTTSAIFTTMTAGRMHVVGYVVITIVLSGLLQPFGMRLSWTQDNFAKNNTFLGTQVSYVDYGGISHVHLLAGTAAFLATIFIGRRLIRLKDIDEASLPPGSDASLTIGYVLVILGTIGLTLPHPIRSGSFYDPFGIKCGLAINGGILAALTAEMIKVRRRVSPWAVARCLQGGIAGMVVVSNGSLGHSSLTCLVLGALGGFLFYLIQHEMFKSALEDYCNVVPIHFYCGLFSILLTLRISDPWRVALTHLAWEIIVSTCLVAFYVVCLVPFFLLLMAFDFLRNRQCDREHSRAMKVRRTQKRGGCFKRLFPPGSNPELLAPGSKVRREEYQDQRLTEEVEVELKTAENQTNRKRRVEEDEEVANKKGARRKNYDEVFDDLEDFQAAMGKQRVRPYRNFEARYAAMNRTYPLKFKKSCKYQLHDKKQSNLAGGDAESKLADRKGNSRKCFEYYEDLADEHRVEVLVETRERPRGITQILEGSNAFQGMADKDLQMAMGNASFELLYSENLAENRENGVDDAEEVDVVDIESQDAEKLEKHL